MLLTLSEMFGDVWVSVVISCLNTDCVCVVLQVCLSGSEPAQVGENRTLSPGERHQRVSWAFNTQTSTLSNTILMNRWIQAFSDDSGKNVITHSFLSGPKGACGLVLPASPQFLSSYYCQSPPSILLSVILSSVVASRSRVLLTHPSALWTWGLEVPALQHMLKQCALRTHTHTHHLIKTYEQQSPGNRVAKLLVIY
jgi:hypothetical protein